MIINSIKDLDHLNSLCCDQFIDTDNYNRLLQFDNISAYVIYAGIYSDLRSYLDSGRDYSDYLSYLIETYPDVNFNQTSSSTEPILSNVHVLSTYELYAPMSTNAGYYFFPYSRKEFISAFYSNVTPTLLDSILDLMRSTGRLTQIGGGSGKAMVIRTEPFTSIHMSPFSNHVDHSQSISGINNLLSSLSTLVSDVQFYVDYIQQQDNKILYLQQTIEELKSKINSAYQTTWR